MWIPEQVRNLNAANSITVPMESMKDGSVSCFRPGSRQQMPIAVFVRSPRSGGSRRRASRRSDPVGSTSTNCAMSWRGLPAARLSCGRTVAGRGPPDAVCEASPDRISDVLTPCAARYRLQVGNFLLGRAILALHNSLPYLMMGNLIRAEIRGCGDLNNRLGSETPRLRREMSTFPGYPKLGQTPKFGSSRIVRVPEV